MCLPALSPPTKLIAFMDGWSQIAFTVGTVPCTTFKTPGGKPARSQSSAMIIAAPGSRSEGLTRRVLPVANAKGIVQRGIILQH